MKSIAEILEELKPEVTEPMTTSTKSSQSSVVVEWETQLDWAGVPRYYRNLKPLAGGDYDKVVELAKVREFPLFVLILGKNGNGKTHMGTWLFSMWYMRIKKSGLIETERGGKLHVETPDALWTTEYEMCLDLKSYSREGYDRRQAGAMYVRPHVLMIDDVFTEKTTATDAESISEVLDQRKNCLHSTIMTTNKRIAEIAEISSRIADRLCEGEIVTFDADSYRIKKFKEKLNG